MRFNDQELANVAAAVIRFNPYAKGYKAEEIVSEMKTQAWATLADGAGYVATRGYVLSAYLFDGEVAIRASVDASILGDQPS